MKNILVVLFSIILLIAMPLLADSGIVTVNASGQVTADVWNGTHSEQYLDVMGSGLQGTYNWSTDSYPGRGTALIGDVSLTSSGDAQAFFSNWVDFSQTTGGAKEGMQYTVVRGEDISLDQTAGRHQGYAMTETFDASVAGPDSYYNDYLIKNYTVLGTGLNTGGPPSSVDAYHDIYIIGTGSASMANDGWTHAAVRAQGLQFDSNGGWGPTGYPNVSATGSGHYYEGVYGSNYAKLGTLGGSYMTLPSGGLAYQGADFTGGFSYANMDARANNGGI